MDVYVDVERFWIIRIQKLSSWGLENNLTSWKVALDSRKKNPANFALWRYNTLVLDNDNEDLLNMLVTFIFQTDNYKMLKNLNFAENMFIVDFQCCCVICKANGAIFGRVLGSWKTWILNAVLQVQLILVASFIITKPSRVHLREITVYITWLGDDY